MREFERAIERGEDTTVATFVLEQLRKIVRGAEEDDAAAHRRSGAAVVPPARTVSRRRQFPVRPGQIRRASLAPVWQWLARDGAPDSREGIRGRAVKAREAGIDRQHRAARCANSSSPRRMRSSSSHRRARRRQAARAGPRRSAQRGRGSAAGRLGAAGAAKRWKPSTAGCRAICGLFGESQIASIDRSAQRSLAADAATAAVRAVAGDAAADRAVADHPPRHQDGRVRR